MPQIKRYKHLNLAYGQFSTIIRRQLTIRRPADTILQIQNKLNRPDTALLAAGASHVDENPGVPSQLPPQQRGGCLHKDLVVGFCQSQNPAVTVASMSVAQRQQLADQIVNSRGRVGIANDGGIGCATSQMGESSGPSDEPYMIRKDEASLDIERRVAIGFRAIGCYYFGGYDGAFRKGAITPNYVGFDQIATDQTILTWARTNNANPFGTMSFMPHTSNGVNYRGSALYMDVLVQFYYEGYYDGGTFVYDGAFRFAMARAALRALAAEKDGNGNDYHTSQQKADILSRRVCCFTWNVFAEVFNKHITTATAVPGGKVVGRTFMPTAWTVSLALTTIAFIECKTVNHWDDTTRSGEDPRVFWENHDEEGTIVGYQGTGSVTKLGIQDAFVYAYTPGKTQLAYPNSPVGDSDVTFAALDLVSKGRGWVGDDIPWSYLSLQAKGDSALCSLYDDRSYIYNRYKQNRSFGHKYEKPALGRAAVFIYNQQLSPYDSENVSFSALGQTWNVGSLPGAGTYLFLIDTTV